MPKVQGESSLSLNAAPAARLGTTPLSLRATPYRFSLGKPPPNVPRGTVVVRWVLGMISSEPRRNSGRSRPLRLAGFQYVDPKSTGAAVEAPAIARLIGPAPGLINPCPGAEEASPRRASTANVACRRLMPPPTQPM